MKACEEENESLRIKLFHCHRKAKNYDDAEKLYHETVTGKDPSKAEDTAILGLEQSFAGMLIEQKRFLEAEPISRAVWEKSKQCPGPPSEISKESHRQLCSALCALGRYRDAETMHLRIYQSEDMDAWALENGDQVCQRRKEQRDFKKAKEMQEEVWNQRRKQNGVRDDRTIQSGLCLIGFLEELVAAVEQSGGTDAERRLNISCKQASKDEIEVRLREIWDTRLHPEPNGDILSAGHKLGSILFQQSKFSDAEAVFIPVWEGRRQQRGDKDVSTMSSGGMLGKALHRQGKQETHLRAISILRPTWHARLDVMKIVDAEAISIGEELAQAYRSLGDWPNAEYLYKWILHQRLNHPGCPPREIEDTRWLLGQTLYNQGTAKASEAENVLSTLYRQWEGSSPNSNLTLQCGQMLAQSLSTQDGRNKDALNVALKVFNGRCAAVKKGVPYFDGGRLYGSLLLKDENFSEAERTLELVWKHSAEGTEEQKVRLKCGHLYGQALAKEKKYPDAKGILDAVVAGQGAILPAGLPEIAETRQLLEEVNRLEKEKKRVKRNSRRKGFTSIF